MACLGIDPSLNSTGYAFQNDEGQIVTGRIKPGKLRSVERLAFIRDSIRDLAAKVEPTLAVIEDYAMGARGKTFHIGEGGGVIRLALRDSGVRIVAISPQSLKMFAIGGRKSGRGKEAIRLSVAQKWGYRVDNDDEADAFVCLKFAQAYLHSRYRRRYDPHSRRAFASATEL